jgi:hypothetical protein
MTDVTASEMPIEPVPPVPQAPDAAVCAEGPDLRSPVSGSANAELDAAPASAAAPAERAMPEIEYPIGPLRQAVLDALADADEPLSVARIIAELPTGTSRGSGESAIRRELVQGRIERVGPGLYVLAKPTPAEQSKPAPPDPPAVRIDGMTDQNWLAALENWAVNRSWDTELGPSPDQADNRIPPAVRMRFADRLRKRQERRREAEAAATARAAADQELRDKLIAATGGNVIRGPGIEDVAPIKLALQVVPIERLLSAIRYQTDRKLYPKNEPARSWGEPRLLKAIAESIVPSLVATWTAAGTRPSPMAPGSPPAGAMPDDIVDRSHHDHEHTPAGPHVVPQPDAARAARGRQCVRGAGRYPGSTGA